MNLSHSLAMDSEVKFEKGRHYRSFDIHFKPAMLERVALIIPELVLPFLNDYQALREVSLFRNDVSPNSDILRSVRLMLRQVTEEGYSRDLLDKRAEVLLCQLFLWKAELEQRRGLSARQLEIARNINEIKKRLAVEESIFLGIKHYARLAKLSPTEFKQSFKGITGFSAFDYWKLTNLQKGLWRLLTTEDSVKDIALEVGYNSTAAFDKAFRKVFEESPLDYRKRMTKYSSR